MRTTSSDGNAWEYFTQDHSRSQDAYKWGEDGLGPGASMLERGYIQLTRGEVEEVLEPSGEF